MTEKQQTPRLTMPSNGGLSNPKWPYSRFSNPVLENFKFEREAARRAQRTVVGKGSAA